jgi:hypothetical protein
MARPDGLSIGEESPEAPEAPEADVAEQHTPVDAADEDTWREADRITTARGADADEADLIEQAIAVPLPDDDLDR